MADFGELLASFLLADNETRNAAEGRFEELRAGSPDECMTGLLSVLRANADPVLRSMAAVLIRRVLTEGEADASLWGRMSPGVQRELQAALLQHLQEEDDRTIKNKVVHTTALIGMITLEDGKWPELMPFIHEVIHHDDPDMRIVALALFEQLAYYIASCMESHFPAFFSVFDGVFGVDQPLRVYIAATRASVALVSYLERPSHLPVFSPLVPHWMSTLNATLNAGDRFAANETLSVLIELADVHAATFKPCIKDVCGSLLEITNTAEVPQDTRSLALELVNSLVEQAPYLLRKIPDNWFLLTGMPVLFALMVDVSDDPEWESKGADADNTDCMNLVIGEAALDRWSSALGQKRVVPVVESFVSELVTSETWQYRHAGLMALSQVVDTMDATYDKLTELTDLVLPHIHDDHPRVRHAAVDVLGMLAHSQSPSFQKVCGGKALPALVFVLGIAESPRGQAHAAEAVVNFVDMADPDELAPHLDELVSALGNALGTAPPKAKGYVVVAISALAEQVEELFEPYYDAVSDALKGVITEFTSEEHRELRGKAFECLSTAGSCVGADRFREDAVAMMDLLLGESYHMSLEDEDPQRQYMWQAFGHIAKVLGEEFAPYLNIVLPSLLAGAANQAEIVPVLDNDEAAPDIWGEAGDPEDDDEEQLETARRGQVKFKVKTAALSERCEALRLIKMFAADMVEAFVPYAEEALRLALPILDIEGEVYDDIKSYAMCLLPDLITSTTRELQMAERAGVEPRCTPDFAEGLFHSVLEATVRRLGLESSFDLIATLVQTTKLAVEAASEVPPTPEEDAAALAVGGKAMSDWRPVLNADQLAQTTRAVMGVLQRSVQRRATRHAQATVDRDDVDEEEHERIWMKDQREGELQYYCCDAMGSLAKTHGAAYLPVFSELMLPRLQELTAEASLPTDKKLGLFLIDDLLEHTGPQVAEAGWLDGFMHALLTGAESPDDEVRQAAVYGIGSAASTTGDNFAPYAKPCCDALASIVTHHREHEAEAGDDGDRNAESVHDNAVSALGKVILLQEPHIDAASAVPFFVSTFPLRFDIDEARVAMQQLCSMIANGNAHVYGDGGSALPSALAALATMLTVEPVITERLVIRMVSIVRALQASLPAATMEGIWGAIPDAERSNLEAVLADPKMADVEPAAIGGAGIAAAGAGVGS